MNDELANIWQEQPTAGITLSVDDIRARAHRLKAGLKWRRRIEVSTFVLLLLMSILNLLFWGNPVTPWFRAAQLILYVVAFTYLAGWAKKPPITESRILTLNMLAVTTSCVEFYRNELEIRLATLRHGRRLGPVLVAAGALLVLVGTKSPRNQVPIVVAGSVSMIVALLWHLRTRREFPRVQAELQDLEATVPKRL